MVDGLAVRGVARVWHARDGPEQGVPPTRARTAQKSQKSPKDAAPLLPHVHEGQKGYDGVFPEGFQMSRKISICAPIEFSRSARSS